MAASALVALTAAYFQTNDEPVESDNVHPALQGVPVGSPIPEHDEGDGEATP